MLVTNISRVFSKSVEQTVIDLIGKDSKWPDPEVVIKIAEKRIVVYDESNVGEDINYMNVKRQTSNAPTQSKGISAHLSLARNQQEDYIDLETLKENSKIIQFKTRTYIAATRRATN